MVKNIYRLDMNFRPVKLSQSLTGNIALTMRDIITRLQVMQQLKKKGNRIRLMQYSSQIISLIKLRDTCLQIHLIHLRFAHHTFQETMRESYKISLDFVTIYLIIYLQDCYYL